MREKVRPRSRYGDLKAIVDAEHNWKDDAFFGWIPGHGPDRYMEHELHRPLEAARLKRLPSFTEKATEKFMGLRGKGLGVVKVNIMKAKDLAYPSDLTDRSGLALKGRPSACVELAMIMDEHKDESGAKYTQTVENEKNPVFDTG